MLERLRELPRFDSLRRFLDATLEKRGDRILAVVLFGSMAKGNYTKHSDYDLLIVVSEEELNFKDRIYEYSMPSDGWVEPLVYTKEEAETMLEDLNPLLLDSLKDGISIYDKGFWKQLKAQFDKLIERGIISPKEGGWIIHQKRQKAR